MSNDKTEQTKNQTKATHFQPQCNMSLKVPIVAAYWFILLSSVWRRWENSTSEIASGLFCEVVLRGIVLWPVLPLLALGMDRQVTWFPGSRSYPLAAQCAVIRSNAPSPTIPVEFLAQDLEFLLRPHRDKDRVPAYPTVRPTGRLGAGAYSVLTVLVHLLVRSVR